MALEEEYAKRFLSLVAFFPPLPNYCREVLALGVAVEDAGDRFAGAMFDTAALGAVLAPFTAGATGAVVPLSLGGAALGGSVSLFGAWLQTTATGDYRRFVGLGLLSIAGERVTRGLNRSIIARAIAERQIDAVSGAIAQQLPSPTCD